MILDAGLLERERESRWNFPFVFLLTLSLLLLVVLMLLLLSSLPKWGRKSRHTCDDSTNEEMKS